MISQSATQIPQVGAYSILRELGADGFGPLYQVRHPNRNERLLMRVISPHIVGGENFLVRFELLRPLLPTVAHKNLLPIIELGTDGHLYFIVYRMPCDDEGNLLPTFANYDVKQSDDRMRTCEHIFSGIAEGLLALIKHRDSFFQAGISMDSLSPNRIYIGQERSLVGGGVRRSPLITGYAEPFLFFGDTPEATLNYRFQEALADPNADALFRDEWLYPPSSRRQVGGKQRSRPSFSLAQMIHKVISGNTARGIFPSLEEEDPTLDSTWDQICEICLDSGEKPEEARLQEVVQRFRAMREKRTTMGALERQLRSMEIPTSMALINFDTKVELGAADGDLVEQPNFRAKLRPFLIDKLPVTVAQFTEFLGNYQPSTYSRTPQHPATLVSWPLAHAYCRWRSEKEGLPPDTYRLPTEYEWEAAARGVLGHQYPWGPEMDPERCHCDQDKDFGAIPVKQLPAARFGIYDMLGNVWEWTESIFKAHPYSNHQDRRYGLGLRVVKGGCWFTPRAECRASLRNAFPEEERSGHIGFRCVRPIEVKENDGVDE